MRRCKVCMGINYVVAPRGPDPRQCNGEGCNRRPTYGPLDGPRTSARYCLKCLPQGQEHMFENVVSKRCEQPGCNKQPSYGPLTSEKLIARCCVEHIPESERDNWGNVVAKLCIGQSCRVRANFGPLGGNVASARYCVSCIPEQEKDQWENVVNKRCHGNGCKKHPFFGPLSGDSSSARYCASCIPLNEKGLWENVVSKRCEGKSEDGQLCRKQPRFGLRGGKPATARFCSGHVPQDDLEVWEDVVSTRCEGMTEDGERCRTYPVFGPLGGKRSSAKFCAKHVPSDKREAWEDVQNKRCAGKNEVGESCRTHATFGVLGGEPSSARYCAKCVPNKIEWENVTDRRCAQEGCSTHAVKGRYRGYCMPCFASLFPLEPIASNFKTKERLVVLVLDELLKRDYTHLEVTYDKQVVGGCSRRRPDIAVDVLTHVVIVECDEDGHDTEDYCSCENKRMMQLFQDYGNRPIVFIRFNPDAYTNSVGVRISSCFTRTPTGLVKLTKEKTWNDRLRVLKERVKLYIEVIPSQEVTVEHLYYDDFH